MSILLIDLSGIYWANWHATKDLEVSEAYERTVSKVASLRSGHKYIAVCCDSPPYLRKEILPEYKAQRDAPPPMAIEQLNRVKSRLKADGLLIWECRGFEADDVIATAVRLLAEHRTEAAGVSKATDNPGGAVSFDYAWAHRNDTLSPVVVASSDKDLLQLVSDERQVSVLSPMTGKELHEAEVIEKFGVHPAMLGDALALAGDPSDNVPGVPSVGPKTAAKLLHEFGTLEGVLTHYDDIPGALGQKIRDHGPAARLARKVIALRTDVPIDVKELFMEREQEKLPTRDYDLGADPADAIGPEVAKPDALAKVEPEEKSDGRALVAAPQSFEMGLEPQSIAGAYKLAEGMFQSRLYLKFGNAESIWAVIIRGREMGIGALTALDCFHVIEGKPAIHAHLVVARAKQHPDCEYFQLVSSDGEHAEYVTKNRNNPEPTRLRYTLEQARVAGLAPDKPRARNPSPGEKDRRGNWEKRPEEMLRKTCAVQLARVEYPEAAMGLYSIEELEE